MSVTAIFTYSTLFVFAVILGGYFESWALFIFSMLIGGGIIHKSNKQVEEEQFDKAKRVIAEHSNELKIRRNQLSVRLNYGLVDDDKWKKEVEVFVARVVAPVAGWLDPFGKNYTRVRDEIEQVTSDFQSSSVGFSSEISPIEYEQLVANVLQENGWNTRLTAATGDQGIDVIAEKQGVKVVIQCKLYSSPVGNAAVQEAIAGKSFERADFAAVVTNAGFTRAARQLASSSGAFLLHHDQLCDLDDMCGSAPRSA